MKKIKSDKLVLIIDVQPFFVSSFKPKFKTTVAELAWRLADKGAALMEVNYEGYEPANLDLPLDFQVEKCRDDGSSEILRFFHSHDFWPKHLYIMGCNRGACVEKTVRGLLNEGIFQVAAVEPAIACTFDKKNTLRDVLADDSIHTIGQVIDWTKK